MRSPFDQRLTALLAGLAACDVPIDPSLDPDDVRSMENGDLVDGCVLEPVSFAREKFDNELHASNWLLEVRPTEPCRPAILVQAEWTDTPHSNECGKLGRYLCLTQGPVVRSEYGPQGPPISPSDTDAEVSRAICTYPALFIDNGTVCGRPLRDPRGHALLASPRSRSDWAESAGLGPLPPRVRRALTTRWLRDAQAEHASIASFAKLTLDLIAHGAPADLIARAAKAQADEVKHARTAYGIVSALLGRSVGPGPLPMPAQSTPTLAELAASTVRDGCVNESVAAAEAMVRLAGTRTAVLRSALAAVATDEAEHAVLARDIVAWAETVGGEEVRRAVQRAWAEAQDADLQPMAEVRATHVGLCGTEALAEVRRQVLERLVAPERELTAA